MEIEFRTIAPAPVLFRRERLTIPQVPQRAGPAIESLFALLQQANAQPTGPLIFAYYGIEADPAQEFDLDICVPVSAETHFSTTAPIGFKTLAAFECLAGDYVGSMHGIAAAWKQVAQAWRESGRAASGESREVYQRWIAFDSPENVTQLQKGIIPLNSPRGLNA